MDSQLLLTFAVLRGAVALVITDRLRPDLVALLVVFVLGATGVLTPQEAFAGFSRSAVITVMAIFVLADGLRRTGVADRTGALLVRTAGHGEGRLVALVMAASASLSLLMNNIAAAS